MLGKVFNILGHEGNTNVSFFEIQSHPQSEQLSSRKQMTVNADEYEGQEEPSPILT